ncbi:MULTISPECIES: SDR family NAD(P)-dependent oxidoreductase [Stutzerimonas stutzeri group]|jgi:3-oxoacyl-[acyl-carrier protein] reductase|uniref:SDR family NAD(P)-dependent oxidoreductase n=1 Tax=Stutzerimonas stutzeri group TaxID=136846 RepID=UPI000DAE3352|nr:MULTISPECIES: SDR family NAD(P)-dependent oxidoreductase [Stutzerimonas stutzeri group]HAN53747.1 short-chain dehydrogenase [Pseudomonas sp.]MTI92586.1 SDR family oxidoreductase [Stutzerimonas stutzeri]QTF57060.1 SDR family oxidoreductase [Stutzerimonas frequens]RAA00231.1 short-chain dehydrogenase [Stutzerimonas stutzeri]TGY09011.1 SDR family oxidoreductase [Stutzerimonas stutzeri]
MTQPVALITGAASGIGQALAVAYARAGVRVVGGYFAGDPHAPSETRRLVEAEGGECLMLAADVTDSASLDALAKAAVERFGRLDYAVANAGLLRRAPLLEMTDERWNEMLDVDLTGVMRTFRSAVRHIGEGGALVAISSIAGGVYGWQDHAHYAAAKAGVPGLCRSLAVELAPRGIRCNAVIPGLIETPQSLDAKNSLGPEGLAQAAKAIPLGRVGRASEVADLVHYLTSPQASYLTGQSIIIDGGLTVRWPD